MTSADLLIRWRDTLLDRSLGIRGDEVLNAVHPVPAAPSPLEVAAGLMRAVNALRAAANISPQGRLDYARLQHSQAYLEYHQAWAAALGALDLAALDPREVRLAFWINVYNALVIDAVIALGVRRSVAEGRGGLVRFFRRAGYLIGGHRFSCDDIEHGVLRGNRGHPYIPGAQFGPSDPRRAFVVRPPEARIHFALNCASRSCPPVGVYEAGRIDAQLDLAARSFVGATVTVDRERRTVRLSRIFRWFARDFGGRRGVVAFLLQYLPADERREWLATHRDRLRLAYQPYDWGLNAS